ncbi:MAG TPA: SAM-dependent methyltransferase [Bacteroidetes bacterium]|nr:SAM-dependent methyltransferase [Bacteroidota bacterium]
MNDSWTERWNERYSNAEYAYGTEPNDYLKEQLEKQIPGNILFPAEGEGRNAVFAAKLGWKVCAFDISSEGQKKALRLAEANKVHIDYRVGELEEGMYEPGQFDAMAFIYAHFPAEIRPAYHKLLNTFLRKDGILIFEAFSKRHLDYIAKNEKVGGPRDHSMLFSIEEVKAEFPGYSFLELEEKEIELNEGSFHYGTGSVIRFVGRKR